MNAFFTALTALTGHLLRMSLQAALVVVLVILVQWLGRKTLSPRVRYALWLLVGLRLVLPTSLESSVSVFQHVRTATTTLARAAKPAAPTPAASAPPQPAASVVSAAPTALGAKLQSSSPDTGRMPMPRATDILPVRSFPWPLVLSTVWLAGVVFLLGRIIWIPLRLNARLARHEMAPSPAVFEILEQAKRSIGVNQVLPIVQSSAVESPALLGFIRPWLLLPHGLVEKFTPEELRLVFLHELAHLKRRDIAVNWLTTLLQILHWFNPLVWYAFARMRADREEACDELALSFARAEENRVYGHAIIKLLEGFSRPPALPGLVGILEDKQHMKRRITMIAQFKKMIPWSATAAGLLLVLGLVTLTDAQTEKGLAKLAGPFPDSTMRTLLSTKGDEVAGVLSPDETLLALIDWSVGKTGLAVKDVRTGETRTLVPFDAEEIVHPVWSPDSQSIAFHSLLHEPYREVLRVVSRSGGEPKTIFPRDSFFADDWSRDGKFLLGSMGRAGDGTERLGILDVATGEMRVVASFWPAAEHARFSPDGKFIVYERFVDGNRDVYVTSIDGQHTSRLTDSPAEDGTPVFSADGKVVLFSSNRRAGWDLWGVAVENGRPMGSPWPIKYGFGDVAKWTTASGKLAFRIGTSGIAGDEISADVYVVDGSTIPKPADIPRPLAKAGFGKNYVPSWSSDGARVAYVRMRGVGGYQSALCVQSLADGREELFETGMARITRIYWTPDGSQVALAGSGPGGGWGIYLFSFVTRKLTANPLKGVWAGNGIGFSADGNAYVFTDSKLKQRMAIDLATGESRPISSPQDQARIAANIAAGQGDAATEFIASADGSVIAFIETVDAEQRLVVADGSYNNRRIIARAPKLKPGPIYKWLRLSPDKQKLAYFDRPTGSPPAQFHVAAVDGSWNRLVETGPKQCLYAPTWSADSSKLAVTLTEKLAGEIGVLENFLPTEKLAAK